MLYEAGHHGLSPFPPTVGANMPQRPALLLAALVCLWATPACHILPSHERLTAPDPAPERVEPTATASAAVPVVAEGAESEEAPPPSPREVPFWRRWLWRGPPFELDAYSRDAERNERGRLVCPDVPLETYRGETIRYKKATRINSGFREKLKQFEKIASQTAIDVYGRPPTKIVHFGTYNCRTIRKRRYRLSEHALGNAIDVAGFEFASMPRKERGDLGRAGRSFRVNVERHWDATKGFEANHSLFLKLLVARLREDGVFRGMIVPPAPGHHNHLHIDMGRWAYLRGDISIPEELIDDLEAIERGREETAPEGDAPSSREAGATES